MIGARKRNLAEIDRWTIKQSLTFVNELSDDDIPFGSIKRILMHAAYFHEEK